jgi:hypothetical protein
MPDFTFLSDDDRPPFFLEDGSPETERQYLCMRLMYKDGLDNGIMNIVYPEAKLPWSGTFCLGDLRGGPGSNFDINVETGDWCRRGRPEKGDVIGLLMERFGVPFEEIKRLADRWQPGRPVGIPEPPEFRIVEPPDGFAPPNATFPLWHDESQRYLFPSNVYPYHDPAFGWKAPYFVARYLLPDGDKTVRPWIYALKYGETAPRLRMKGPPGDWKRPIYGLLKLEKTAAWKKRHEPGSVHLNVLVVEGEKCQEAAIDRNFRGHDNWGYLRDRLFGGEPFVPVSWAGGTNAVARTDWSPLAKADSILILPDADEAGIGAAEQVAMIISRLPGGGPRVRISYPSEKAPKGWDIADALARRADALARPLG